ncbi:unnamed protein product [Boreogadus saida]
MFRGYQVDLDKVDQVDLVQVHQVQVRPGEPRSRCAPVQVSPGPGEPRSRCAPVQVSPGLRAHRLSPGWYWGSVAVRPGPGEPRATGSQVVPGLVLGLGGGAPRSR